MFAPRSRETKFLQYYLQHSTRPGLTVLSLERGDLPALYNLARKYCNQHKIVSVLKLNKTFENNLSILTAVF